MPTPNSLREIRATPGQTGSEVFVFCTPCHKITVTIDLKHSGTEPIEIKFKAERRPGADENRRCHCDEEGWVQFVKETQWEFDNSHEPRGEKIVGDDVPEKTPARGSTGFPGDPEWDNHIWYGLKSDTARKEVKDTPGVGTNRVEQGENKDAFRKEFTTRYVCRNKAPNSKPGNPQWLDGVHSFELKWTIYHHDTKNWTKLELSGSKPIALNNANDGCP